jgi:hypothetical protein
VFEEFEAIGHSGYMVVSADEVGRLGADPHRRVGARRQLSGVAGRAGDGAIELVPQ